MEFMPLLVWEYEYQSSSDNLYICGKLDPDTHPELGFHINRLNYSNTHRNIYKKHT